MTKFKRSNGQMTSALNNVMKIGVAFERLFFFGIIFFLLCHVAACLAVFIAKIENYSPDTWIVRKGYQDDSNWELYVSSYYFTVTTITTVGFGDITPETNLEKILVAFLMLAGVISFSFAAGSLSSILSNLDTANAAMKQKVQILDTIRSKYEINPLLYEDLMQSIVFETEMDKTNIMDFVKTLPRRLKVELTVIIHHNTIAKINYFKNKEKDFIAFVGPMLDPYSFKEDEFVYKEGDDIESIYFISTGVAGFVLTDF